MQPHRRHAVGHARRHRARPTRSRPTATTRSASCCTARRPASCSAASRAATSRSSCRSTASASRCSTSTAKMSETDKNGLNLVTPRDSRQGRPAAHRRRVHPEVRRRRRRPGRADRLHAGRHRVRRQRRHHHPAARARLQHHRAVQGDRRVRHAEPPQGVHLPADRRRPTRFRARARSCRAWRARPTARTPNNEDVESLMEFYGEGAQGPRLRGRHQGGAAGAAGEPEVRVPLREHADAGQGRARPTASATSIWRRGCRSSSGTRCRTPSW